MAYGFKLQTKAGKVNTTPVTPEVVATISVTIDSDDLDVLGTDLMHTKMLAVLKNLEAQLSERWGTDADHGLELEFAFFPSLS